MTKHERWTLYAIAVVCILGLLGLFLWRQAQNAENAAASTPPVTFSTGSVATLDSGAEDLSFRTTDGTECRTNFGWNGTMELTVLDSTLYKNEKASEIAARQSIELSSSDDRLLLVTCRLKNIDATPDVEDYTGEKAFSASIFNVPGIELRFFSASQASAGNHEYFSFQLNPGEEIEFTLGYPWQSNKPGSPEDVPSIMTPGVDGTRGHYQIELGTSVIE